MNNDVLTEIFLHLPVQSLLRFKAVCKFWGDVIDSPSFRKLHTQNNNSNKSDDAVCLQVSFPIDDGNRVQNKLSIKLQHNKKSLMLYESDNFNRFSLSHSASNRQVTLVGPVKGLICIDPIYTKVPIAICNPLLGQVKILPLTTSSSSNSSCRILVRNVAIGFDEEYYKVVQLLWCNVHRRHHFELYSPRTDSWRELADGVLDPLESDWYVSPIESWCKNGYFTHWLARQQYASKSIILSLDMKNEVLRTITVPDYPNAYSNEIFSVDAHSFLSIVVLDDPYIGNNMLVRIYESRCEGTELSWNYVMNVKVPSYEAPLWREGCLFFKDGKGADIVYDYCARKVMGRRCRRPLKSEVVEYRGSFVSL